MDTKTCEEGEVVMEIELDECGGGLGSTEHGEGEEGLPPGEDGGEEGVEEGAGSVAGAVNQCTPPVDDNGQEGNEIILLFDTLIYRFYKMRHFYTTCKWSASC